MKRAHTYSINGQDWLVSHNPRKPDIWEVKITTTTDSEGQPLPPGEIEMLARLNGNPLDPGWLERFAAMASSRNNGEPQEYAATMSAIVDKIAPMQGVPHSSTRPPHRGGVENGGEEIAGELVTEMAGHPPAPPRRWGIDQILPVDRITMLFGAYGSLKTFLAALAAICVANGLDFLGHATERANVLWVDNEDDADELQRKLDGLCRGLYLDGIPSGIRHVPLTRPLVDAVDEIADHVKRHNVGLLVMDSLGPALAGDPERADVVIPVFEELRSLPVASLIIDHEAKTQTAQAALTRRTPFGSQFKGSMSRSLLSAVTPDQMNHPGALVLLHQKSSYARPFEPKAIRVRWDGPATFVDSNESLWDEEPFKAVKATAEGGSGKATVLEQVLAALKAGPASLEELAKQVGSKTTTVRNNMSKLLLDGYVRKMESDTAMYELIPVEPPMKQKTMTI